MTDTLYLLPETGMSVEEVTADVDALFERMTPENRGKLSSTSFWGDGAAYQLVKDTHQKFFSWNALFTFQEEAAAKLENEVLDICMALAGGSSQTRSNLTSGGTESNFCAFHAMRNWAREKHPEITAPEIVAPYSIHSTVHKTARMLDIRVVTVPQRDDLSADMDALAAVIGPKTIGIAGSAPSWPYGCVDPIEEMAALALEHDLWLHVDACVGAYILPFFRELGEDIPPYDLSIEGVRSLSGDLHKYGYAPKPCSTIIWKSQAEQSYHYLPVTEWPCGLYLSQGFVGSRPLAPVAAIWALMHHFGKAGYIENARRVLDVRNAIIDKVASIDGLHTWPTHGPLIQIASDTLNIQLVVGGMESRGWRLLGVNDPPAIHLTIDYMHSDDLHRFLFDLEQVVSEIRAGRLDTEGLLSYGGVGAAETAPKWLLSAVEIMQAESAGNRDESHGKDT
jgi:glutamate/tyrosine decarboxylase-like PLP-dependent enzyme